MGVSPQLYPPIRVGAPFCWRRPPEIRRRRVALLIDLDRRMKSLPVRRLRRLLQP